MNANLAIKSEAIMTANMMAYENQDTYITPDYVIHADKYRADKHGKILMTVGIWTRYDVLKSLKHNNGQCLTARQVDRLRDFELDR